MNTPGITNEQWLARQALADVRQTGHVSKYIAMQMECAGMDSDKAEQEAVRMINSGEA